MQIRRKFKLNWKVYTFISAVDYASSSLTLNGITYIKTYLCCKLSEMFAEVVEISR